MRYIIIIVIVALVGVAGWFGFELYNVQKEKTELQYDYAEIRKINYGLFNIQLWKEKAMGIFQSQIDNFEITPGTYKALEQQIGKYINIMYNQYFATDILVDQIEQNLQDSKIPKMFLKALRGNIEEQIDKFDIKGKLPLLTKNLSKEIKKNEPQIKQYVQESMLDSFMGGTEQKMKDKRMGLYQKYEFDNEGETIGYLRQTLGEHDDMIDLHSKYIIGALGIALFLLSLLYSLIDFKDLIVGLTLISIVLLLLGITLPMIDIDARLNSFKMEIMGDSIEFDEQVMYFQSKSIYDVTTTLWRGGGIDLKIVGALIFLFSIVFPIIKLTLSTLFLYMARVRQSNLAKNIIFYLGKWSMADVFVVAIFMAYIGFYGIVTSQLGAIGQNQTGYAVETVNYSRLAPGAMFFTLYCIVSIFTSILINRRENIIV